MKDTTFEKVDQLIEALGAEELVHEIVLYLSKDEAEEMAEYISNMHEIEIR